MKIVLNSKHIYFDIEFNFNKLKRIPNPSVFFSADLWHSYRLHRTYTCQARAEKIISYQWNNIAITNTPNQTGVEVRAECAERATGI